MAAINVVIVASELNCDEAHSIHLDGLNQKEMAITFDRDWLHISEFGM